MKRIFTLVFFCIGITVQYSNAQIDTTGAILTDVFADEENFQNSIPMYEELLKFDPNNSDLNYRLGFCYLNSVLDKDKSIPYFEAAIANMSDSTPKKNAPIEVYFHLGRAYRVTGNKDKAIATLTELKSKVNPSDTDFLSKIDGELNMAKSSGGDVMNNAQVRDLVAEAEELIDNGNFIDAVTVYRKLLIFDHNNSDWNFKMGFCYLNSALEKEKAINYFQKALNTITDDRDRRKYNAPLEETQFFLGKAYRVNYMYDEAIGVFTNLKNMIPTREVEFHAEIDHEMQMCENVLQIKNSPVSFVVTNLGKEVNSEFADHSPVVSVDESILMFTSKRAGTTGGKQSPDGQYYEDIYMCHMQEDSTWSTPAPININTGDHEATIGLSADGQTLFIYRDDLGDGNIYMSTLDGDKWSTPVKLPEPINTKFRETHASLSSDGKMLFFTSDRKGGYGELDIYMVRKLPNGEWGAAENLGPIVNTRYNEEGPYIHPDGVTLYFSSQGHTSMGGFDIFQSTYDPETYSWSDPQNIGYPINTTEDDVFYIPTADGKRAYYSSQRSDDNETSGGNDLYLVSVPNSNVQAVTVMSGFITICTGVLPELEITLYDTETQEILGIVKPNAKTGKYLFVLQPGRDYHVEYLADGNVAHIEELYVPEGSSYQAVNRNVRLRSGTPCDDEDIAIAAAMYRKNNNGMGFLRNGILYDEKIEIKHILFPFGQANEIVPNPSLDVLSQYLKENPEAVIEIGAYADAVGPEDFNLLLTQKRAQVVLNYLVKKGANEKQLVPIGYGEANPIAFNTNPDGSWNRDAQRFNRRIEFKVIKQGKSSLWVAPLDDVPTEFRDPNYVEPM